MNLYISKRAEQILIDTKFNLNSETSEWILISQDDDKKLTVQYRKSDSKFENLALETWSILLYKRNPKRLVGLTFKEFENFLRDDNGHAAFDSDTQEIMERIFFETKVKFLELWPWNSLSREFFNVNSKSYINSLGLIASIFELVNTDFELNSELKLVHFEYEYVYFYNKSELNLDFLITRIENFLSDIFQTPIKLVAVRP